MTALLNALPAPLRSRNLAIGGGFLVLAVLGAQVLPSTTGRPLGTPLPILVLGLVTGMITGLTAAGIVFVYRTSRVINFAQTAMGSAGAALCFNLLQLTPGVPFLVDFAAAMLAGGALGLAFHLVFERRFFNAPRLNLTVLTIAAAAFLGSVGSSFISALPFFPPADERDLSVLQGSTPLRSLSPFAGFHFTLPGMPVPFGFVELFAIGTVIVILAALGLFLRLSRFGTAVRALAENSELASLLGISVGLLSAFVWTVAGLLSGAGLTLTGLLYTSAQATGFAPAVLLPALAAAVIAGMRSIPVALAASVAISILTAALTYRAPNLATIASGFLLVVIAAGLLLQRQRRGRSETAAEGWRGVDELRAIPTELAKLGGIRTARRVAALAGLAGIVVFPFVVPTGAVFLGSTVATYAIACLSLVVLTGWSGQVSLGQFAFVAIGAVTAGAVADKAHLTFWLAVPVAVIVTAAVAAGVGLPALRLPGLFLAIVTFGFAAAVRDVLFNTTLFGWLLPAGTLRRPTLFALDFEDERWMYFLCAGCLVLAILVVVNLRRTRFGRILMAIRDNEAGAAASAIAPVRTKVSAFAVSGSLAGFAGALFAFQQRGVDADSFNATASVTLFIQVVVGGVGTLWGALLGPGVILAVNQLLSPVPVVAGFFAPLLALLLLYVAPGGLIGILASMRDAVLRIVARRNGLIVPSLFADLDPAALHLRLIQLAPALAGSGLNAIRSRYLIPGSMLATASAAGHNGHDNDLRRAAAALAEAGAEAEPLQVVP